MPSKTIALPSTDALFGSKKPKNGSDATVTPEAPNTGKPECPNTGVLRTPLPPIAPAVGRDKYTTRLDNETLMRVEDLKGEFRRRTGKKIRTCWMIEAAVRYVYQQMDHERALEILKAEMERLEK